jgi:hypothetical protein
LDVAAMIDRVLGPVSIQSAQSDQSANSTVPFNAADVALIIASLITAVAVVAIARRGRQSSASL